MSPKATLRPVDDGWTLIGYELIRRDEQRIGFIHLEDIVAKPDPASFVNEWIEKMLAGEEAS